MGIVYRFKPLSDIDVQGLEIGQTLIKLLKPPVVVFVVDGQAVGLIACGTSLKHVTPRMCTSIDTVGARYTGSPC